MKILILEKEQYLSESKDAPEVGRRYFLEDAQTGSKAQNNTFHALIDCFYKWMLDSDNFVHENGNIIYDFSCPDAESLKKIFKARYGAGADYYKYVNDEFAMVQAKTRVEIPEYAWESFTAGNKHRVEQVLKGWGQYTIQQRTHLIDMTIKIMDQCGCDSKKYFIILEGMAENDR